MPLARSTKEYIELTSAADSPFIKTRKQVLEWLAADPIFQKLSTDQVAKFKESIHYDSRGRGIGDFYFADLEVLLTKDELEGVLAKLGIAPEFFSIIRDYYCKDGKNCAYMEGTACPYLHGMGCGG